MAMERIELRPETDLRAVVERVWEDKMARLIERDGEPLAVLVSPEQFGIGDETSSKRRKELLLSLAGVWADLDADRMIDDLYRRRREATPGATLSA